MSKEKAKKIFMAVLFVVTMLPITALQAQIVRGGVSVQSNKATKITQVKPVITSPKDGETFPVNNTITVKVTDNANYYVAQGQSIPENIEVTFLGLNGQLIRGNNNESGFDRQTKMQSGGKVSFTTDSRYGNKYVKIIAFNKANNTYSDAIYIQIQAPQTGSLGDVAPINKEKIYDYPHHILIKKSGHYRLKS